MTKIYPTLSSPLVDSVSSNDSAGAWMVTDLSPRMLMSRLFERCLSLLSLEKKNKAIKVSGGLSFILFYALDRQQFFQASCPGRLNIILETI